MARQAAAPIKYNNVKAFFALCEQSKKRFCSIKFEHGKECFLRHLDRTDLFHALLAFFLLFEQFTLSGYVAAVAFGRHILADGLDGFTISKLSLRDVKVAQRAGYRIKLLGRAVRLPGGGRTAYVAPHLIPEDNPMSNVEDVFNAVMVRGNATGEDRKSVV